MNQTSAIIQFADLLDKVGTVQTDSAQFKAALQSLLAYATPAASTTNTFTGTLALDCVGGTYWPDLAQTGAITITPGVDSKVGGIDRVKITANGSAITLDAAYTWKNLGSDEISTTLNDVMILIVNKVGDTYLEYTVKLN